jgi:hypothetical protein
MRVQNEAASALMQELILLDYDREIRRMADIRWRELGYASLSAYVTGLIRYDLLLGGPHQFDAKARTAKNPGGA